VFGPAGAWSYAREWIEVLVLPGVGLGEDRSRARELIDATATDSQSLLTVGHNLLHPDRASRPAQASPAVRWTALLVGGLLTLLTLAAAGWRQPRSGPEELLFLGTLVLLMVLLSPVCHRHYFCLAVPLVTGLLACSRTWNETGRLAWGLRWLLGINVVTNSLAQVEGLDVLRDLGLALAAALLLWASAVYVLWRTRGTGQAAGGARRSPSRAFPLARRADPVPATD
jgi:hypothetical protein